MQPVVPSVMDLIVIPFTLYLLGCAIYLAQVLIGRQAGTLPKRRWSAVILIVIGSFVAWGPAWKAMNPDDGSIYRMMLTRKLELVMMGTPFVGLVLILGMVTVDLLSRRYIRSHYMD